MVALPDSPVLGLAAVLSPALGGLACAASSPWRSRPWLATAGALLGFLLSLATAAGAALNGPAIHIFADWIQVGGGAVSASLAVDMPGAAALVAVSGVGAAALLVRGARPAPGGGHGAAHLAVATSALGLVATAGTAALAAVGWATFAAAMYSLLCAIHPSSPRAQRLAGAAHWLPAALVFAAVALAASASPAAGPSWLTGWDPRAAGDGPVTAGPAVLALIAAAALIQLGVLPFHGWLVATASAPPAAAAILHGAAASTGLYLLLRCRPLFDASPDLTMGLIVAGSAVSIPASLISLRSRDLSGGLACAAASQAGLAVPLALAAAPWAGAGLLVCWGLARGGLCLAAGVIRQSLSTGSSIDGARGLRHVLPLASWCLLISAAVAAGLAPLAGFWSAAGLIAAVHRLGGPGLALLVSGGLALSGAAFMRLAVGAFAGPPRTTALTAIATGASRGAAAVGLSLGPVMSACLPPVGMLLWNAAGIPSPASLFGLAADAADTSPALQSSGLVSSGWVPVIVAALTALTGLALAWFLNRRLQRRAGARSARDDAGADAAARAWADDDGLGPVGRVALAGGRHLWTLADTLLLDVALVGGVAAGVRGMGLAVARLGDGRRVTSAAAAFVLVALVLTIAVWGMG